MLALGRLGRLPGSLFKCTVGKHLGIQPVRIGGRQNVAEIVHALRFISGNDLIDQIRVDQGAITGNAYDRIGLVRFGSLVVTIKHIIFAALKYLVAQAAHMISQESNCADHRRWPG